VIVRVLVYAGRPQPVRLVCETAADAEQLVEVATRGGARVEVPLQSLAEVISGPGAVPLDGSVIAFLRAVETRRDGGRTDEVARSEAAPPPA